MAYNTASRSNARNNDDNFVKAKAFVNLYIPRVNADGSQGRFKLVGIPVRDHDDFPNERTLMAWLNKDPANVTKLLGKMEAELVHVNPAGAGALCLD